ncbi:MAG: hypothetical protein ACK58L_08165 [Planctomycetota bacterium]
MITDDEFTEQFHGAVIRLVLLSHQIPAGWETSAIGSRAFRQQVQVGFRIADRILLPETASDSPQHSLMLLTLPDTTPAADFSAHQPATESLRRWVAAGDPSEDAVPMLIQLQGVLMCVGTNRAAVSGSPERIQSVTGAVLEHFWLQTELQQIEHQTASRWSELEEDTPAAFEWTDAMLARREQLQQRFQTMIIVKAKLARLAPLIESPAAWPPTLASQAAERLREKSRLPDRLQFLRDQLDVFERVYELCGQRMSDFISSRKSHTLEWIIVVLLAFETLLLVVDLLGTLTTTP